MLKDIVSSARMLAVLTALTGVLYTLVTTIAAAALFGDRASGGFIERGGVKVGSALIAQKFESDRYFWPRPSAVDYGLPSGGSNLGPISSTLRKTVAARRARLTSVPEKRAAENTQAPPADLLFASASGVDPHISPEAAKFQVGRVARARGFDDKRREALSNLVERSVEKPQMGFIGEPVVNVLKLNLALDGELTEKPDR